MQPRSQVLSRTRWVGEDPGNEVESRGVMHEKRFVTQQAYNVRSEASGLKAD